SGQRPAILEEVRERQRHSCGSGGAVRISSAKHHGLQSIAQAAGCCRTSGFFDLDLLLLLRHLRRLWQFDSQYAVIKLRLDFRWIWIERQGIARLNEP